MLPSAVGGVPAVAALCFSSRPGGGGGMAGRGGICMHSTTKRRPGLCALAARASRASRASRVVSVKGVGLGGQWRDIGAQLRGEGVGKGSPLPRSHAPSQTAQAPGLTHGTLSSHSSGCQHGGFPGRVLFLAGTWPPSPWGSAIVGRQRQFWFLPCLRAPIPT